MPLKFGNESLTSVTCARAQVTLVDRRGRSASGWGETPLSVQWAWPSLISYAERHDAMREFCRQIAREWLRADFVGHPLELGHDFEEQRLKPLLNNFNLSYSPEKHLPYLAALICSSPFDIAIHDAYGKLHNIPTYGTYNAEYMNRDLAEYYSRTEDGFIVEDFRGKYPEDFLVAKAPSLPVWHLVGGLDPLAANDLPNGDANDGYPVVLTDWIRRDGLNCLKIKLCGTDIEWDFARLIRVGRIASEYQIDWLSADFNCTVREVDYVNEILDRVNRDEPDTFSKILYVEQPFAYDLAAFPFDVRSIVRRKPLFLDESAHNWQHVELGRSLGWSGVALKTCKTQSGALLSLCWAQAHGMAIMVQDLSNPMLAQLAHVQLAAHVNTIMGVESNGMQFYPAASKPESEVHSGIFERRNGVLNLRSMRGSGIGYRIEEIHRELPEPEFQAHMC
jgi:L-alanine-DL-glutamate epimerase-like enolase superfamily enzyme